MYKNALHNIDNVAIWPIVSFIIFFVFFLCLIWYVIKKDRKFIERMKHMPFDKGKAEDLTHRKP